MVRKLFLKQLNGIETKLDYILDKIEYNNFTCGIKHIFRFIKRLPKWLKLCWKTENWDYEGIYDFLEMFLQDLLEAQQEDTWHTESGTGKRIKQIKLTQEHLKRYKDPFAYYEFPDTKLIPYKKYNEQTTYVPDYYDNPEKEAKINKFIQMEEKHYKKFWKLLEKYHRGWWT